MFVPITALNQRAFNTYSETKDLSLFVWALSCHTFRTEQFLISKCITHRGRDGLSMQRGPPWGLVSLCLPRSYDNPLGSDSGKKRGDCVREWAASGEPVVHCSLERSLDIGHCHQEPWIKMLPPSECGRPFYNIIKWSTKSTELVLLEVLTWEFNDIASLQGKKVILLYPQKGRWGPKATCEGADQPWGMYSIQGDTVKQPGVKHS